LALLLGSPMIAFASTDARQRHPGGAAQGGMGQAGSVPKIVPGAPRVTRHLRACLRSSKWSGRLQKWMTLGPMGSVVSETIWDNEDASRRASRPTPRGSAPADSRTRPTDPPSVVRDGGTQMVKWAARKPLVEEFTNQLADSQCVHEVDVDAATGVPHSSDLDRNSHRLCNEIRRDLLRPRRAD